MADFKTGVFAMVPNLVIYVTSQTRSVPRTVGTENGGSRGRVQALIDATFLGGRVFKKSYSKLWRLNFTLKSLKEVAYCNFRGQVLHTKKIIIKN